MSPRVKVLCLLLLAGPGYYLRGNDSFAGEADWKESLKTEAPKKWAAYEEAFVGKMRYKLEGRTLDLLSPTKQEKPYLHIDIQFGTAGVKEYYQHITKKGSGYAFVLNDRYAFGVRRNGPDENWVMTGLNIKTGAPDYLLPQMKIPGWGDKRYSRVGPFEASGIWLPEMFEKNHIDIVKASTVEINGKPLPRFEFVGRPKDPKKVRGTYPASGWFVLNPQEFWRVQESEIRRVSVTPGDDVVVHSKVECAINDGVPVMKKVILVVKGTENNVPVDVRTTTDYSIDRKDPDPADFTLSAFGLPEPMGMPPVNQGGSRWYLWLTLATVAMFGLFFLFRKLRQRYLRPEPVAK